MEYENSLKISSGKIIIIDCGELNQQIFMILCLKILLILLKEY